jgi:hypothetical protein
MYDSIKLDSFTLSSSTLIVHQWDGSGLGLSLRVHPPTSTDGNAYQRPVLRRGRGHRVHLCTCSNDPDYANQRNCISVTAAESNAISTEQHNLRVIFLGEERFLEYEQQFSNGGYLLRYRRFSDGRVFGYKEFRQLNIDFQSEQLGEQLQQERAEQLRKRYPNAVHDIQCEQ